MIDRHLPIMRRVNCAPPSGCGTRPWQNRTIYPSDGKRHGLRTKALARRRLRRRRMEGWVPGWWSRSCSLLFVKVRLSCNGLGPAPVVRTLRGGRTTVLGQIFGLETRISGRCRFCGGGKEKQMTHFTAEMSRSSFKADAPVSGTKVEMGNRRSVQRIAGSLLSGNWSIHSNFDVHAAKAQAKARMVRGEVPWAIPVFTQIYRAHKATPRQSGTLPSRYNLLLGGSYAKHGSSVLADRPTCVFSRTTASAARQKHSPKWGHSRRPCDGVLA